MVKYDIISDIRDLVRSRDRPAAIITLESDIAQ
jgi:hypothetical protein